MKALGLIEVIGYPPAIEAADAALKAANVTLLCIAKADAGIMTVELTGDVGAVTSAVDAGAEAAKRVGTLRARHVIPRVEQSLLGTMIIPKETKQIEEKVEQVKETPPQPKEESVKKPQEEKKQYTVTELKKMSNQALTTLLEQQGVEVNLDAKTTNRKQQLIGLIMSHQENEEEGDS